jgi:hypothetical protein
MDRHIFSPTLGAVILVFGASLAHGTVEEARELERTGDPFGARQVLERLAKSANATAEDMAEHAAFLDRYGDPGAIEAYSAALAALATDDVARARDFRRRLVLSALMHGDSRAARDGLDAMLASGDTAWERAGPVLNAAAPQAADTIAVTGTLNSFRRMAALSTDLELKEILPSLGRTIFTGGYHAARGTGTLEPTEYLKLLKQYLTQAKELDAFAGDDNTIDVPVCESAETAQLLKIIGYRLRGECGPDAVLETVNPSRAFLAIDSAFPLTDLELAFRRDEGFHFPYSPTRLPLLFDSDYWLGAARRSQGDFLDTFIDDPGLARLYVAMYNLHRPTAVALRDAVPVERLKDYAPVLDFFGAMFEVQGGTAIVAGGERARPAWEKLTGTRAAQGGRFFQQLIELDDGWMAAFYDALARVQGDAAKAYFLDPGRIERFYAAVRGKVTSPGPARPIFRASADLLLLSSRLDFNAGGAPRIPGGIVPWRDLFVKHPHGKYDGKLTESATRWTEPDDVIEAMFALCRKAIENEPLRIFLAVSNMERNRSAPLSPEAVARLIQAYPAHGEQFALYNDSPDIAEETIFAHLDVMAGLDRIGNALRRADTTGTLQAQLAIWQVLRRNGAIPDERADSSMQSLLSAAGSTSDQQDVFEAGRDGVRILLEAAGRDPGQTPQETLIDLLVGVPGEGEQEARQEIIDGINQLLTLQRLVPLKTLFDLADHLERVSRGEAFNVAMANRLSESISDIRLPRSLLSVEESNAMARGHWVERHIQRQRTLNLRRAVDRAQGNPNRLLSIRGGLAPILRDSLVGIVYALYSPPGAELIRANPLFVRSHDFLGPEGKYSWARTRMQSTGWPSSGGGRLVGSLMSLPYELASAEQNFMIPTERQALIWQDLAPQMLLGATLPRWWKIQPADLHYVGLHLRLARSLLAQTALDPGLAETVREQLARRIEPARVWKIDDAFRRGQVHEGLEIATPAELFDLAHRLREVGGAPVANAGAPYLGAIEELESRDGERFSESRIASRFGMPHPRLAHSYRLELLNVPLFPTLMGYSSRILAESWESNNLYWAELSDELHIEPARLNLLIPQWTQRTLERIFATHLDDWPALWRSLRMIADQVRAQSGVTPDAVAGSSSASDAGASGG